MAEPNTAPRSDEPAIEGFVLAVFGLAGIEYGWAAERVLRVRRYASLAALFGDAEQVELALDTRAAADHPAALLCAPGSFAMDELLRLARSLPGGYRSTLLLPLPGAELPPGLPLVENGHLAVERRETVTRRALRAVFRVALQSAEPVERLLVLVVDSDGRLRPDLADRGERAPRSLDAPAEPVPGELLDVLEQEAGRHAALIAAEQLPPIQVRKAGEVRRLEQYLAALRDERAAELPAGAPRRAAQIQAEGRALLDALRTVLPGDGPWDRDEVLRDLTPRLWSPALRMRLLPPRQHQPVLALIRRLPRRFSLEEAEALVARETQRRLERLARARPDEEPGAALVAEHEQRLESEHAERLRDIDEKYHLRVLATPALLEWLEYPALACELRLSAVPQSGAAGATVPAAWDALAEAWDLPPCPACGASIERLWLCEHDHTACGSCAIVCAGCRRARCPSCEMPRCAVCGDGACEVCGRECESCGGWTCPRHFQTCPDCARTACSRCGGACAACETPLCREHHAACSFCQRGVCHSHVHTCYGCRRSACPEHGDRCAICGRDFCGAHGHRCVSCGERYCGADVGADHRCRTCGSLEPIGDATTDALRTRLAEVLPEVDLSRHRQWWLGRNGRVLVVVARRWPRSHWFVLHAESRVLRRHRVYWRLRGP
jgi:hypothetical protein